MTLSLTGLKPGGGDTLRIEQALEQLPGVILAYVNPATEMAYIEYDPELTGEHHLAEAIDSPAFRAQMANRGGVTDGQ